MGHELAGQVVEVGREVQDLKVGDKVSIDPNIYCGNCVYCRDNQVHLCNNLQAVGVTRNGGMAEYCVVPQEKCFLIPDTMSFEEAAMVEPLGCVLHGFQKLKRKANHSILIIGGGFIGQLFLQLVKLHGMSQITVVEPVVEKHALLSNFGATNVITPVDFKTDKEEYDIVIECVGRKETMEQACHVARKGGQILLFGVSSPSTSISVSPFEIFSKELTIHGSFINPYTHAEAISLIANRSVRITPLISHHFSIEEVPELMLDFQNKKISKAVISL